MSFFARTIVGCASPQTQKQHSADRLEKAPNPFKHVHPFIIPALDF